MLIVAVSLEKWPHDTRPVFVVCLPREDEQLIRGRQQAILAQLVEVGLLDRGLHPIPITFLQAGGGSRCAGRNFLALHRSCFGRSSSGHGSSLGASSFLHHQRWVRGAQRAWAQEQWRRCARKKMEQGCRWRQMTIKTFRRHRPYYLRQIKTNHNR